MKIGIDIMGGDFAPTETVKGAIAAYHELEPDTALVLIGDEDAIRTELASCNFSADKVKIVHASEVIGMGEHPTKAISQKPNSSIAVGFGMLKQGLLDSFAGAGNTGAMLVGAMFSVKPIEGVLRPALTTLIPMENGKLGIFLDAGANADCKPEVLQQFAILGSLLAEHVYGIPNPRVSLLSIGEEEEKGNMLTVAAHQLLKKTADVNFIGNVEGRDIFSAAADVIVCDGFTGNIVLKLAESFYTLVRKRGLKDEYFDRFNYESYGGTPILGINSTVVIGHGISKMTAVKNMILFTKEVTEARLADKIREVLKHVAINPTA